MKWVDIKAGAKEAFRDPHPMFIITIVILALGAWVMGLAVIHAVFGTAGVFTCVAIGLLAIAMAFIWNEAREAQEKREYRERTRKGGDLD